MLEKTSVTARLGGSNTAQTFGPAIELAENFNLSLWGEFTARVTIQRSFDNGATWLNVARFDRPVEAMGYEPETALYRVAILPNDFMSGTVCARLGPGIPVNQNLPKESK